MEHPSMVGHVTARRSPQLKATVNEVIPNEGHQAFQAWAGLHTLPHTLKQLKTAYRLGYDPTNEAKVYYII